MCATSTNKAGGRRQKNGTKRRGDKKGHKGANSHRRWEKDREESLGATKVQGETHTKADTSRLHWGRKPHDLQLFHAFSPVAAATVVVHSFPSHHSLVGSIWVTPEGRDQSPACNQWHHPTLAHWPERIATYLLPTRQLAYPVGPHSHVRSGRSQRKSLKYFLCKLDTAMRAARMEKSGCFWLM